MRLGHEPGLDIYGQQHQSDQWLKFVQIMELAIFWKIISIWTGVPGCFKKKKLILSGLAPGLFANFTQNMSGLVAGLTYHCPGS